ncbi:MAG: hypothetical protein QOD58_3400, partial [Mycobacterium sp.]|nr:hypothetical protein [Mycobacterium sp.]
MTGFPTGRWSPLLVGDQWPDDRELQVLQRGKMNRGNVRTNFTHLAEMLRDARMRQLSQQQGRTADDLRGTYNQGEKYARRVVEKNRIKEKSYDTAYDSMISLQHDLANLAVEGNAEIEQIRASKEPEGAKVSRIISLIRQYRALANIAAAKYASNLLDAMQQILDAD